jgi:hypothetical protein
VTTDPYRLPVGATTPNDIPFIFKSGKEFPSVGEDWIMSRTMIRRGWRGSMGSQVDTEYSVPQLCSGRCKMMLASE